LLTSHLLKVVFRPISKQLFSGLLGCCLIPAPVQAVELEPQSLTLRARLSEQTVLGEEAPEDFKEYDLAANFKLPWPIYSGSSWGVGTRLMASTGLLRGSGKTALVVSLIPELTLESNDGRFVLDVGAGAALMSRHRFGTQDYGGPFQFALTAGFNLPLYKQWGVGYRFLHYSDAGVNGPDTTGADFHMIEFSYKL